MLPRLNLRLRLCALLNNQFNIQINGKSIKKVLGLFIDEHLTWTKHIDEKCEKISSAIGALKRIRPFISESTALQIYQSLILPHFDCCSYVWDELNAALSDKLQKLQTRAARIITTSSYDTSVSFLLNSLHRDKLSIRRKKLKAILMFKTIKGAFGYSGTLLWNSLPTNLRKLDPLKSYKRDIDVYYNNCKSGSHAAIL